MAGETEAIAGLATAALIARATGGEPGGGAEGASVQTQCLNCGTALTGSHCHACGQAGGVHRSLGAIWHDLAHGAFHFEGKIWRTLPLLVTRPGELTRRYVEGERTRFLSPLALFLFSMFLMFAVIAFSGVGMPASAPDATSPASTRAAVDDARSEIDAEIAKAIEQRRTATGEAAQAIDIQIRVLRGVRANLANAGASTMPGNPGGFTTGWSRLDSGIAKARANPGLLVYKLQSSAYKFSWALVPLSVPFVALLFLWRRRYHMYDHAVFVTYSLSFMSLLVIALSIAGALGLGGWSVTMVALTWPPFHMYRQLRGAYALGRFSAIWRLVFLLGFAFAVLLLFLLTLLGWGILG